MRLLPANQQSSLPMKMERDTSASDSKSKKTKNYRKRRASSLEREPRHDTTGKPQTDTVSDDEQERRMALEEIKFLQKQRERKYGIPANPSSQSQSGAGLVGGLFGKLTDKNEGDGGGDNELVLQDTFAQETAVMVEDPNMVKYVEQELAKKRGRKIDAADNLDNDLKSAEDELYKIPEHLKVKRRNSEESSTQWTTGIAEVQLPIEYKLKNIEETEAAKKLLQEKRLMGRAKSEFSIPSSYSADYLHLGRDYAEKLRREPPELYKGRSIQEDGAGPKQNDSNIDAAGQRQAATDEFMLNRFRKRERQRVMRR